jgi:asparagine synthase (glutamine-hydrolysing)
MCGICGFNWSDETLILRMRESLRHRGPDDCGLYVGENISLGHRRLSVIDLTEKARQPMHNEDETIWIVYNGEVYNFREIRGRMEERGYRFNTESDT